MLLQRTPVLRLLTTEGPGFTLRSGELLKSAFALAALGAYDTVAGATVFNGTVVAPTTVTPASGAAFSTFTATGAVNTAFSVAFTATGAPGSTKSWKVLGTFPAGLSVTGGTAITGGYLFNGITKVIIAGTPTAGGSRTLTVTGYDTTGGTGNNASITCVININAPPAFTTQPISQTVNSGSNVTFTAAATGTPTPTFQWFKGTTALSGQTAATLSLTAVTAADAADYKVVATNSLAPTGVSSSVATLSITSPNIPPVFTTQPISQTVNSGSNVTFTAAATGTPAPTFQWFKGTTSLTGKTAATLSITGVTAADAADYKVVATNAAAPSGVSSSVATLVVQAPPVFTTQPISQTVNSGSNVTFTAAATGTPTPTFQWFKGTTALSGQTAATLSLTAVTAADAADYKVVATNSLAPTGVSSSVATLSITSPNIPPVFTTQPISQTVNSGSNVTFTAAATGTPAPTFQWFKGTTSLTGKTAATLSITGVTAADAADYKVVATNAAAPSGVSSSVATLVVQAPPVFTSASSAQFQALQTGQTFTFTATGLPAPTFSATGLPAWATLNSSTGLLSGTPSTAQAGSSVVTLTASNGVAPAATQSFTLVVKTALRLWQEAGFTAPELANPSVSGNTAVIAPDGLSNLVHYALGYGPRQTVPASALSFSASGSNWKLAYTRPTVRLGIAYTVESSTDLASWTTTGVTHQLISSAAGIDTWSGTVPAGPARIFLRLKIAEQ